MNEKMDFFEYVRNTIGIIPEMIPEKELNLLHTEAKSALKTIGYKYTEKGIKLFEKENLIKRDQIVENFQIFESKVLNYSLEWIEEDIKPEYRIDFVDLDEYWMNYISTDQDGNILLRFNLHKRHKWIRGCVEYLVMHEILCHAIQALCLKNEIRRGKLIDSLGITMVFSPEQFIFEGIAESLVYFLPSNYYSDFGYYSMISDNLYWQVWNNAHIMANSESNLEEIFSFVRKYLPQMQKSDCMKKN